MYSSCATHPKSINMNNHQRPTERMWKRWKRATTPISDMLCANNADSKSSQSNMNEWNEWMYMRFDMSKAAETFEPNIISRNINFPAPFQICVFRFRCSFFLCLSIGFVSSFFLLYFIHLFSFFAFILFGWCVPVIARCCAQAYD